MKKFIIALVFLFVLFALSGFWKTSSKESQVEDTELRLVVLSYLSQRMFEERPPLESKFLGRAELVLWDRRVDPEMLYFKYPEQMRESLVDDDSRKELLSVFLEDSQKVNFAYELEGVRKVGELTLREAENVYFTTPLLNFKVEADTPVVFNFGRADYSITPRELGSFVSNRAVYGGYLNPVSKKSQGITRVFVNHGAFVAKPGEPSMKRLLDSILTKIENKNPNREQKLQAVLDFVSNEITYDTRHGDSSLEVLQRPNEVLMMGKTDCGNKAVLLCSLFEQMEEDYVFLYYLDDMHGSVAVEQGRFENENGYGFSFADKKWVLAEPTASGFQIGYSELWTDLTADKVNFIQRPRECSIIYNAQTGEKTTFE